MKKLMMAIIIGVSLPIIAENDLIVTPDATINNKCRVYRPHVPVNEPLCRRFDSILSSGVSRDALNKL